MSALVIWLPFTTDTFDVLQTDNVDSGQRTPDSGQRIADMGHTHGNAESFVVATARRRQRRVFVRQLAAR